MAIPLKTSHRHLHLNPGTSSYLESKGCEHFEDLKVALSAPDFDHEIREEVVASLRKLVSLAKGENVDWLAYYSQISGGLREFYFLCPELEVLSEDNPGFAVNRRSFGNAGAMFERAGLSTFGALLSALRNGIDRPPAGLGKIKQQEFLDQLLSTAIALREGELSLNALAGQYPIDTVSADGDGNDSTSRFDTLSFETRNLAIGSLHLGAKAKKLTEEGYDTVGRLASASNATLLNIPGMGQRSVDRIDNALSAILAAQEIDGTIDWDKFCCAVGVRLFPESSHSSDFADVLASLPAVLSEAFETCESVEDHLILTKRIMAAPKDRLTLEAVSELFQAKVTRERVRQKEAKILSRLARGLVADDYARAPYRFRGEFTQPWKLASAFFSTYDDDISFNDFVHGLEKAWGIPRREFSAVLPLITAIISGELPSGEDFRSAILFDTSHLRKGEFPVARLQLHMLQVKKSAAAMRKQGIGTVGGFLKAVTTGRIAVSDSSHTRKVYDNIRLLAKCTDRDGLMDWWRYAELSGVPFLPIEEVNDPRKFLDCIIPTSVSVLNSRQLSSRAAAIFSQRTAVHLRDRPTTEAMATRLGGLGVTIKMTESKLLKFLREVFVEKNVAIATVHLSAAFLEQWSFVEECFPHWEQDTDRVLVRLAEGWGLEQSAVAPFMPAIVAIISGYPLGRLARHHRLQKTEQQEPASIDTTSDFEAHDAAADEPIPQRIVLRGFRRQH